MKAAHYAVIMAGGSGTRFWPLSRVQRPKQLLKIFSPKSLIRETLDRVLPLFGRGRILVVTVKEHLRGLRKELPFLSESNFLVEPQGNNTAPCIGLAALELLARDPNATMAVFPADHWISDTPAFRRTLRAALKLGQEQDALVTLGVRPLYPETGYGYIQKGRKIEQSGGLSAYRVKGFKEKPSVKKAAHWIRLGCLWNSGIFVWRAATILSLLDRYNPALFQRLRRIQAQAGGAGIAIGRPKLRAILAREYRKMPNLSIDYAVLEKAGAEGKVLTLETKFGWSDVGNWAAVRQFLPRDREGNVGMGEWLGLDSKNCLVYSRDRLVVLLGMRDAMVVDSPDALLVGDIRRAQEVRQIVSQLEKKGYQRYLIR